MNTVGWTNPLKNVQLLVLALLVVALAPPLAAAETERLSRSAAGFESERGGEERRPAAALEDFEPPAEAHLAKPAGPTAAQMQAASCCAFRIYNATTRLFDDFDGDGVLDVAYVETPHIGGTLRIWSFADNEARQIASDPGYSNHRIGQNFITGGVRDCGKGPELVLPNAGWTKTILAWLGGGASCFDEQGNGAVTCLNEEHSGQCPLVVVAGLTSIDQRSPGAGRADVSPRGPGRKHLGGGSEAHAFRLPGRP